MSATNSTNSDQTPSKLDFNEETDMPQTIATATSTPKVTPEASATIPASPAEKIEYNVLADDKTNADKTNADKTATEDTDTAEAVEPEQLKLFTNRNDWDGTIAYNPIEYRRKRFDETSDAGTVEQIEDTLEHLVRAFNVAIDRPTKLTEILQILRDAAIEAIKITSPHYIAPKPAVELSTTFHEEHPEVGGGRLVYYPGSHTEQDMERNTFAPTSPQVIALLESVLGVIETGACTSTTEGLKAVKKTADEIVKDFAMQNAPMGGDPFGGLLDGLFSGKMPAGFADILDGAPGFSRSGGRRSRRS